MYAFSDMNSRVNLQEQAVLVFGYYREYIENGLFGGGNLLKA
jgi:hypothetical protein